MTIMFSDVRGFTTISESFKRDPQGLTALMNRFLTPLTNAILDRKGTIDKYMGDAIMAFWNAPLDDKQHESMPAKPRSTCWSGSTSSIRSGRSRRRTEVTPIIPLNVGVGLNTGVCVVGNMGSDLRFDYSVLGDSVNLASRLEGQSKEYGFPDHHRLEDRDGGQGQVRDSRARLHHGEGQEGAGGDLCHRRPRGHRAVRQFSAIAQPDHRDAGVLSQPRLGRRAGGDRTRPQDRRRPGAGISVPSCTRPGSPTTGKLRRRQTGTARSRC